MIATENVARSDADLEVPDEVDPERVPEIDDEVGRMGLGDRR